LAKLGLIIVLIRLLEKNQASDFEDSVILDRYNIRWRNELSHLKSLTSSALIS